jgi:hypothetical protein
MTNTMAEEDTKIMDGADPLASSDDDMFRHHRRLFDWVTNLDGYMHPDIRLAHHSAKGFHILAHAQIQSHTRVVSCPMSATMSVLNALDIEPFKCHGPKFPKAFLANNITRPEMVQTFFLVEQYLLGDDSWWSAYIKTLPTVQDVNDLQFESPDDIAWLTGTNLRSGFDSQTAKWQELYTKGLRNLKVLGWQPALQGKYTWELYRWAATVYGSRSFTSSVLDDTLPADQARMGGRNGVPKGRPDTKKLFEDKFSVLLPMLDILNHWPVTPVEWQARSSFVGLQVLDTYRPGEELCNNYGPKDNEGLLLSYGFVIPENQFDHVVIALKAPAGSPLDTARTSWKRDDRSHPEFKSFLLNAKHPALLKSCFEFLPFSYDLLDGISILSANDRELQEMYLRQQTLMSRCLGGKFEDTRNVLATLSQLYHECSTRLQRLLYPKTLRANTPKQVAAKVYRDSQIQIFEFACALARLVLDRATSPCWSFENALDKLEACYTSSTSSAIRQLSSTSFVTSPGELIDADSMQAMLPTAASLAYNWRLDNTDKIVENADNLVRQKTQYAVLLCTIQHEYDRGTKLPQRLNAWMEQLCQWYPPTDPNWTFVPHRGPWSPGEEPPSGLMALLKARESLPTQLSLDDERALRPSMLCWGWNVLEEEGVVVPTEALSITEETRVDVGPGEVRFLMYMKHI